MKRQDFELIGWMLLLLVVLILAGAISRGKAADLDDLNVQPERLCSPYDHDDYDGYRNIYHRLKDGLIADAGGYVDAYTLSRYVSPDDLDIDHRVARYEAHRSGLCAATEDERDRFARDPRNMALTHWYINRIVKKSKDVAEWLPPKEKCAYAQAVIDIRAEYGLTVDKAERSALSKALKECEP